MKNNNKTEIPKSSEKVGIFVALILLNIPNFCLQIETVRTKYAFIIVIWNLIIYYALLKIIMQKPDIQKTIIDKTKSKMEEKKYVS